MRHLNDGPADIDIIDGVIVPRETRVDRMRAAFRSRTRKFRPTKPDADGYMTWPGGEIPIDPDLVVDVILRDGSAFAASAFRLDWDHVDPGKDDVVKFRLRSV